MDTVRGRGTLQPDTRPLIERGLDIHITSYNLSQESNAPDTHGLTLNLIVTHQDRCFFDPKDPAPCWVRSLFLLVSRCHSFFAHSATVHPDTSQEPDDCAVAGSQWMAPGRRGHGAPEPGGQGLAALATRRSSVVKVESTGHLFEKE